MATAPGSKPPVPKNTLPTSGDSAPISRAEMDDFKADMRDFIRSLIEPLQASHSGSTTGGSTSTTTTSSSTPSILGPSPPATTPQPSTAVTPLPAPIAPAQPIATPPPVALPTPPAAPAGPGTPAFEPVAPAPQTTSTAWISTPISARSPLDQGVWERYKSIRKSVAGVPAAAGVSFPKSSNIGLSKEEKVLVQQQHDTFKTFKVILQLCVAATEQFPEASEALDDIAAASLAGMRTQLRARDHTWMKKALPAEAVPAWYALDSTTITPADHSRFFSALQYAAYKQQASKPGGHHGGGSGGKQWNGNKPSRDQSSTSSSKSKPRSGKPWSPSSTSNSNSNSHGASSSAGHD